MTSDHSQIINSNNLHLRRSFVYIVLQQLYFPYLSEYSYWNNAPEAVFAVFPLMFYTFILLLPIISRMPPGTDCFAEFYIPC